MDSRVLPRVDDALKRGMGGRVLEVVAVDLIEPTVDEWTVLARVFVDEVLEDIARGGAILVGTDFETGILEFSAAALLFRPQTLATMFFADDKNPNREVDALVFSVALYISVNNTV